MFEKILYPTDFSDASKKALGYVKQLKKAEAKEVIVLHVIDDREIPAFIGPDEGVPVSGIQMEKIISMMEDNAKNEARAIELELQESGFDVTVRIERGMPLREILRVEEEEDVSIIIVGSHGKSLVKEVFLGSVSEQVIRKSQKPVLVIRR